MRVPVAYPQPPQLGWFGFQGQDLEEPGCVFSGTHHMSDRKRWQSLLHNTPLMLGSVACAHLVPPLLRTHVPSLKALPCICGMVLQHTANVLALHQQPVSLF